MVRISICDMCRHLQADQDDGVCPAFPNGKALKDNYRYVNEECGNGYQFEPNEESKDLWDEQMYMNFSRPSPNDLEWEVRVGEG